MILYTLRNKFMLFRDCGRSSLLENRKSWAKQKTLTGLTDRQTDWLTECKPNSPLRQAGRGLITYTLIRWPVTPMSRYVSGVTSNQNLHFTNIIKDCNQSYKEMNFIILYHTYQLISLQCKVIKNVSGCS